MPKTNHNVAFARMRVDLQRLIAIPGTPDELRAQVKQAIAITNFLERKFDEGREAEARAARQTPAVSTPDDFTAAMAASGKSDA